MSPPTSMSASEPVATRNSMAVPKLLPWTAVTGAPLPSRQESQPTPWMAPVEDLAARIRLPPAISNVRRCLCTVAAVRPCVIPAPKAQLARAIAPLRLQAPRVALCIEQERQRSEHAHIDRACTPPGLARPPAVTSSVCVPSQQTRRARPPSPVSQHRMAAGLYTPMLGALCIIGGGEKPCVIRPFPNKSSVLYARRMHLGAARAGFGEAMKLISSSLQASKQQCEQLAKELEASGTQVESVKAELEQVKSFTREAHAESIGQLQKDLDVARESQQYAESQQKAGYRVLQRHLEEKNRLKEENRQQAEQIESLKAQLAQAQGENQNLQRGMFGLLSGRPEEEIGSYQGNLLKEMSALQERARKAMKSMVKALWPDEQSPEGMTELIDRFKGARTGFELWKTSACREGAREAWAMIKTRYTGLNPERMAQVGPVGSHGREVPLHLVYDQVMPAARLSQEDCSLDTIIDNLDQQPDV